MICSRCGGRHVVSCGPDETHLGAVAVPKDIGAGSTSAEPARLALDAVLDASDNSAADSEMAPPTQAPLQHQKNPVPESVQMHSSALSGADLMPLWLIHDIAAGRVASVTTDDVLRLARTALFFATHANPHKPIEAKENQ